MLAKSSTIRLSEDADLLEFEPSLDDIWPRKDKGGNVIRSWDTQHRLATCEIEERLRAKRSQPEQFELGRLGLRSREQLRKCAAFFALHYIYVAADTMGDTMSLAAKASHYWRRGEQSLLEQSPSLDYDEDDSGSIDDGEKNRPFVDVFTRG